MKGSAQNGTVVMWIMLIGIIVGIVLIFALVSNNNKKKAAEQQARKEASRKLLRDLEEQDRIRKEKLRAEEEAKKEQLMFDREMASAAFMGLIGSDRWDEDLWKEPDQGKRIDRLKYDAPKMKVLAYDSRYHIGLVSGTVGTQYIVSGERCNCPDFLRQKKPCKHMYFLGKYITDNGYGFLEGDYEDGLKDSRAYMIGRFPGGKEAAMANLRERGCTPMEVNSADINLAIAGTTTAHKTIEKLMEKEIRIIDYKDALQIFTSEIRHPDVCTAS